MVDDLVNLIRDRFEYFGFNILRPTNCGNIVRLNRTSFGYFVLRDTCIVCRLSGYYDAIFIEYADFDVDEFVGMYLCKAHYDN